MGMPYDNSRNYKNIIPKEYSDFLFNTFFWIILLFDDNNYLDRAIYFFVSLKKRIISILFVSFNELFRYDIHPRFLKKNGILSQ